MDWADMLAYVTGMAGGIRPVQHTESLSRSCVAFDQVLHALAEVAHGLPDQGIQIINRAAVALHGSIAEVRTGQNGRLSLYNPRQVARLKSLISMYSRQY